MTQQEWTFYDPLGGFHTFGMYHSERSGHFVAYLDQKILMIDFGVLDNRSYRFFFDRELLKFSIFKKEEGYSYELIVDREADTQLNLDRKRENRNERVVLVITISVLFLAFLLLYFKNKH
ncbi:MAG TPA: hypothetical protein VFX48_07045 [Saprospiraceae bacterium]|nr:hypothetical protein [Saprospiraceae bacterium]